MALSLLLKHSGRRNKNTDLQISVLRAKSWCLTSASRPADLGAPACTSKKSFKSLLGIVGDISWQCREPRMGPSAQDRRSPQRDRGQRRCAEGSWGKALGPGLRQIAGKVGWAGQEREPHVYTGPLAKQPVWEGFSCWSSKAPIQECSWVCIYIYPPRRSSLGAGGGNCSCPEGSGSSRGPFLARDGSPHLSPWGQQKQVGSGQVEQILTFPPEEFL